MTSGHVPEDHRSATGVRWLVYPEYGPIEAALGFGLFFLLVSIATDPLAVGFAAVFAVDPGVIKTGVAIALWVVLALIIFGQGSRQLRANPHRFIDARDRRAYLDRTTPGPWQFVAALVATLLGGGIIWTAWAEFLVGFGEAVLVLTGAAGPSILRLATLGWIVAFFIGFALVSHGVDRLVIGAVRVTIADAMANG